MMLIIETTLIFLGMCYLSVSLPRHYRQVSHSKVHLIKKKKIQFRVLGYTLMICSIAYGTSIWGLAFGLTYWCALASVAALFVSLILTYKPQWLRLLIRIYFR